MQIVKRESVLLASALFLAACAGGDSAAIRTEAVARDSAGIRIVENTDPVWGEADAWTVAAEPSVTIGQMDGPEAYQLFRVMGVLRLDDGRIAVANSGTAEVKFFDASGQHQVTVGRRGEGPGEFNYIVRVYPWPGDSLLVFDILQCRLSLFSSAGVFGRTIALPHLGERAPCMRAWGVLADGSVVAQSSSLPTGPAVGNVTAPSELPVIRFQPGAERYDTVAVTSSVRWATVSAGRGSTSFLVPFSGIPQMAVGRTRVYYGYSDHYEIQSYSPDGVLRTLFRRAVEPTPVTERHIAQAWDSVTGFPYLRDQMVRANRTSVPFSETLPVFDAMLVDDLGNLWVQDFVPPGDSTRTWAVFDTTGTWLGTVRTPDGVRVWQIGDDFLLGAWSDELDVEYVGVWALAKGRRQSGG